MVQYTYAIDGSDNLVQIDNSTGSATGNFGISMVRGEFGEHAVDGDGNVYFQDDDDSTWHKYDDTGTEVWSQQTNQRFHENEALITDVGPNGSLFLGSNGNRITQLDASDGSIINETTTNVLFTEDFDISADGSILVVGTGQDGVVQTRNTSDLSEIQQVSINQRPYAVAVLSNNNVLVGSNDGNVYVFDNPTDMNQINSFAAGDVFGDFGSGPGSAVAITSNGFIEFDEDGNITNYNSVNGSGDDGFSMSPDYEAVFTGFDGTNDIVSMYDTSDQSLIWSLTGHFQGKGYPKFSAREDSDWVSDAPVYVGGAENLTELDTDGSRNNEIDGPDSGDTIEDVERMPNGDVIVSGELDSVVTRYDSDLNEVWSTDVSTAGARAMCVGGDGYVYTADNGTLAKVDASDGSILWEVTGLSHSFVYSLTVLTRNHSNEIMIGGDSDGNVYTYSNGATSGDVSQIDVLAVTDNYGRGAHELSDGDIAISENNGTISIVTWDGSTLSEASSFDDATHGNLLEESCIDFEDNIYVGGTSGAASYQKDGTQNWSYTGVDVRADISVNPDGITAVPLYGDDSVRFIDDTGSEVAVGYTRDDLSGGGASAFPRANQFPNEWVTIEQINASQTSASASMNTPTAAFTEPITATQVAASGTANTAAVSSLTLTSTQPVAVATSNTATLSSFDLTATQPTASATMLTADTLDVLQVTATQTAATATVNASNVTSFDLTATQPDATTSMNAAILLTSLNATQFTTTVTPNTAAIVTAKTQRLNETNTATLTGTSNTATITTTVNEVD